MNVYTFETINEGYIELVRQLLNSARISSKSSGCSPDTHPSTDYQKVEFDSCGVGKNVNKKSRYHLRNVHVMFNNVDEFTEFKVACPERTKKMNEYMIAERDLFDRGVIDADEMGKISKIWSLIRNSDNTINANYGHMVFFLRDTPEEMSQYEWCCDRLSKNLHTLQAYVHFNRSKDQFTENLDQPCTMFCQFTVEDNKLNFHSYMRSNDVIYGTPYNLAYFVHIMRKMLEYLKMQGHDLEMGYLHHNVTSLHLYEDKIDIATKIVGL